MNDRDDMFSVGQIVGFHGIAGEVKVKPDTNNLKLLLGIQHVELTLPVSVEAAPPEPLILQVRSTRADRRTLFLTFVGLPDRNAVEQLLGAYLYVSKSELPELPEEEFWVKDLVGLDVFTTEGQFVGKVRSIIYGGNDVLEIHRDGDPEDKTILVPFVKDLVPVVDIKSARLEVVDLPGLLESQ
jgi:16S rRNA processing protein RimM